MPNPVQPRMDTDEYGSSGRGMAFGLLSVSIRVHPWLTGFVFVLASVLYAAPLTGSEFAAGVAGLEPSAREEAVIAAVKQGNVPAFWTRFAEVRVEGVVFWVAPDYLAVGTDDDYLLTPLSPAAAQAIADHFDCVLPTRKMVDLIYRAAPLKLEPSPIPPGPEMTTAPVFAQHNATVAVQRKAAMSTHPLGTLVAGHKKDVVITPRLALAPGRVAIYGWHRRNGSAIQPLYLGHADRWVDYSHGVRLVRRAITVDGAATTVEAVLADDKRSALLSDEGPIVSARYGPRPMVAAPASATEKTEELHFEPGVRVVLNTPAQIDPAKPVRLILYGAPAGNTIEQTIGHRLKLGEDWHFDIQHVGAQLRWLRARERDTNLVIAYHQTDERSWVAWRRKQADGTKRIGEIVEALRQRFPGAKLVLTGHSAGGTFTFAYLDSVDRIPDDIERIAFLDSNYAYDAAKGHDAKLAQWLAGADARRLCVLAYEDHVALLDGKTFVSEAGGTWGRSQAMLRDLGARFPFMRTDAGGLQRHVALAGRVQFYLKENPAKAILHTRQVEWNGFIHAMLAGTPREGQGYVYLGERVYSDLIAPE